MRRLQLLLSRVRTEHWKWFSTTFQDLFMCVSRTFQNHLCPFPCLSRTV